MKKPHEGMGTYNKLDLVHPLFPIIIAVLNPIGKLYWLAWNNHLYGFTKYNHCSLFTLVFI